MSIIYVQVRNKIFGNLYGAFQEPLLLENFIERHPNRTERLKIISDKKGIMFIGDNYKVIPHIEAVEVFKSQEDELIFNNCVKMETERKDISRNLHKQFDKEEKRKSVRELIQRTLDVIQAFEHYLEDFPFGKYNKQVNAYLDDLYYERAMTYHRKNYYEEYLDSFPEGKHFHKIQSSLNKLLFKKANGL